MNYTCKQVGLEYLVLNSEDQICGTYNAEHKAKRRIRDLKAKEINAGVHGNLVVPVPAKLIARRVGCYPAIPKRAYRQDWR